MHSVNEFVDDAEGADETSQEGEKISTNHEFSQVSCGSEHSYALTTSGELYSWGLNFKG